jgi:hypothetical protein
MTRKVLTLVLVGVTLEEAQGQDWVRAYVQLAAIVTVQFVEKL